MKNLYEKLSKENKAKISEQLNGYPALNKKYTKALKEKEFAGELILSDAFSIFSLLYSFRPFDIVTFYELFED